MTANLTLADAMAKPLFHGVYRSFLENPEEFALLSDPIFSYSILLDLVLDLHTKAVLGLIRPILVETHLARSKLRVSTIALEVKCQQLECLRPARNMTELVSGKGGSG